MTSLNTTFVERVPRFGFIWAAARYLHHSRAAARMVFLIVVLLHRVVLLVVHRMCSDSNCLQQQPQRYIRLYFILLRVTTFIRALICRCRRRGGIYAHRRPAWSVCLAPSPPPPPLLLVPVLVPPKKKRQVNGRPTAIG